MHKTKDPTEKESCIAFYKQYLMLQKMNYFKKKLLVFHIVNEQFNATYAYTKSLQNMGLVSGVADYGIIYAPAKIAFLEFKRDAKCKLSPNQQWFKEQCEEMGIPYTVEWTPDGAIEWIDSL